MNRERIKELLPVMQAFAEGKTIQCQSKTGTHTWRDSVNPAWADLARRLA